ncbi:hypothetical protein MMC20_005569 [Loxospora ochrophaea]|nr:hypothetical protein [Loxospora ochrophaea]
MAALVIVAGAFTYDKIKTSHRKRKARKAQSLAQIEASADTAGRPAPHVNARSTGGQAHAGSSGADGRARGGGGPGRFGSEENLIEPKASRSDDEDDPPPRYESVVGSRQGGESRESSRVGAFGGGGFTSRA